MRDALQAGMHADSKFKSRQKMNAAKNIQGLNNISAERLVSPCLLYTSDAADE